MQARAFADLIFTGLNQRGISFIVGNEALLNFINLGLCDVFSFEGRYWSFQYYTEQIPGNIGLDVHDETVLGFKQNAIIFETSYPIQRIANLFDKKNQVSQFKRKNVNIINKETDVFYRPLTKTMVVYNNEQGYQLDYVGHFNFLTTLEQYIPIPDLFLNALFDLTMSYVLPIYGQAGEGREVNVYQRGMSKLKELAKTDSNPIEKVVSNIV